MVDLKPSAPPVEVRDIMVRDVFRITLQMRVFEVVECLIKHKISGAPVVDGKDIVVSVIGEGDVLRLAASEGLDATIGHCLPKLVPANKLITLQDHAAFTEAYRLFLKHNIHRIPIVDSNGKLKGLVARSSILKVFIEAHYGKKLPQSA